jgi:hypothetical protein
MNMAEEFRGFCKKVKLNIGKVERMESIRKCII